MEGEIYDLRLDGKIMVRSRSWCRILALGSSSKTRREYLTLLLRLKTRGQAWGWRYRG